MAYGLQITNPSSKLTLSESNRLSRLIANMTVSIGAGQTLDIPYAGITKDGTWGVSATHSSYKYPGLQIFNNYIHLDNSFWNTNVTFNLLIFRF